MSYATYIPNTFQTPNWIIDDVAPYLTGEELRVLLFAVRHILGWQERISARQAHISMSMFQHGYPKKDGTWFKGTWLAEATIRKALRGLVEYGLIERVGDPHPKMGQLWHLPEGFNLEAMEAASVERQELNAKRTKMAQEAWKAMGYVAHNPSESDAKNEVEGVMSHITPGVTSDNTQSNPLSNSSTTRSSEISSVADDEEGGQPDPANAGSSDPQPSGKPSRYKPAPTPALPPLPSAKALSQMEEQQSGKTQGNDSQRPQKGQGDSPAPKVVQTPSKASIGSKTPVQALPPLPSSSSLSQYQPQQDEPSSSPTPPSSVRAIVLELERILGKEVPDTERKNLSAKRDLKWRGRDVKGEAPADLYDRDPRFKIYMKWMVEQAQAADLGATKTIVGMLRNHNRGDKDAPGKILGWYLWEEAHPAIGSVDAGSTQDPDTIDFHGQWVFNREAVPPRQDLYEWQWGEVVWKGQKVWRWYKVANKSNG